MKLAQIRDEQVIKDPPQKELMRLFGMIVIYPPNATFVTQNDEEDVAIVLRKHVLRNVPWLINLAVMLWLPAIIGFAVMYVDGAFFQNAILQSDIVISLNANFVSVFLFFLYSFVASYAFLSFLHWYYDLFIITNERFISIDFDILKGKTVTDIPLVDIIDIKEKALGLVPTLLGYATMEFKTVSELKMIIDGIPEATWFRDSFADLIRVVRQAENYETPKQRAMQEEAAAEYDYTPSPAAPEHTWYNPEATAPEVSVPANTAPVNTAPEIAKTEATGAVSDEQQVNNNIEP